jgi:cytosine/adenosine deaminase-related metal-dependent hydrolase
MFKSFFPFASIQLGHSVNFSHLTAKMSSQPSTLYTHATILTINPSREVILNGAVLVTGSRIAAVAKTSSFPPSFLPLHTKVVSLSGRILLPGLINTHSHLAQSLLRGLAEDLPLHSWLCDAIWPLEASYDKDDGYVAARLTIAEMLKSGTTCFLESMLTHRSGFENVVRAVGESGIRACLVSLPFLLEILNCADFSDIDYRASS